MENEGNLKNKVDSEHLAFQVESVHEQGAGIMNEDQVLITPTVLAVLDGATSLNKYADKNGKTGGFLASSLVSEYIRTHPEGTLLERACAANALLNQEMKKRSIDTTQKENLWCTGAALVELPTDRPDRIDWLKITDCTILFIFEDGTYTEASTFEDHDTEVLKKWQALGDKTQKEKSAELFGDMVQLRRQQNETYGVMNGEPAAEKFFRYGSIPRKGVKHILMFTDGFLIPKEDAGAEENFDECVKVFLEGGLPALKKLVREKENTDPECSKYARYKIHDDMAALAATFENT